MERYIIGAGIKEIETPALLLDLDKLEYNIHKMADFLNEKGSSIRPHFKTHKSPFLAHKQIEAGAIGISCQKLSEAEVLARSGIKDILITNEIIGSQKIKRLVNLAAYTDVKVSVDDENNAERISEAALGKSVIVNTLIELNIGMNRCGVEPGEVALNLVQKIKNLKGLKFMGIMAYEGHTVFIESFKEREVEVMNSLKKVSETRKIIEDAGIDCEIISCGGTGTYMITGAYPGVTEIEAGSYLTMDTKYNLIDGTTVITIERGVKAVEKQGQNPKVVDLTKGWFYGGRPVK